jgi:hypothetical protein
MPGGEHDLDVTARRASLDVPCEAEESGIGERLGRTRLRTSLCASIPHRDRQDKEDQQA